MFESYLVVPLHFSVEFLGFLVCAGGAFLVVSRPTLVPGLQSNRVIAALGLGAIAAAQVIHGGSFAPLDSDRLVIGLYSVGLALLAVSLAGAVRPEAAAVFGLPIKQPFALAPAGAALFLCIVTGLGASRGRARALYRLCAAGFFLAGAEVATALGPETEFGIGAVQGYAYTSHALKALGFLLLGSWLWTGVRSSIRVRFVASFATLLIVVVLVIASSLTGVISNNIEEEELDRTSAQLEGVLTEFSVDDTQELISSANSISADDNIERLMAQANTQDLKQVAKRIAADRGQEIDFVVFLSPDGKLLPFAGEGPGITRKGDAVQTRLRSGDVLRIAGSPVVEVVSRGEAQAANPVRIDDPRVGGIDSVATIAASQVLGSQGAVTGIVAVGRWIDAFALEEVSANLDPASASLVIEKKVAASDLPPKAASKLEVPSDVAQEIRLGNSRAVDQPLGTRSYLSAYAPLLTDSNQPLDDTVFVLSSPARIVSSTREEVTRILFLVAMGIGVVVLLLAWLSGRRITRPIQKLTLAAGAVREGNLEARTEVYGEDEVGQLGETFNEMTAALLRSTNDLREAAVEEQRLRSRIETIIESMADGLVAVDASRKILAFNPRAEELTGIDARVAVGKPVQRIIDARDSEGAKLPLPIYDLEQGSVDGIYLARKGDDPVPVAVDSAVLRGVDGQPAGAVAVIRDMTREREVERMKSEFLSNISHELRTPLTPIKGYAEILGSKDIPAAKSKQFATGILDSTARLERIVELLVDFSAMEAGRLAPRSTPVDLGRLVETLAQELKKRAKRHEVVVDVKARLPKVIGDERLLRRSLEEVVDNAVKFSPEGGTIRLEARGAAEMNGRSQRSVAVTVSDEGIGIPPEDVAKIFSDFQQLDGSETRAYGGLGLGLAFVRRIIQAHEGSVEVDSAPQRGTRLTIKIPAVQRRR